MPGQQLAWVPDPYPGARLRTIATGAVALAAVALVDQAAVMAQVFDAPGVAEGGQSFWERLFDVLPSRTSPLAALAAVVLVLLLPVAGAFDRCRNTVALLVGIGSVAVVNALGFAIVHLPSREPVSLGRIARITFYGFPTYVISAVTLMLVVNTRRWGRHEAEKNGDVDEPFRPPGGDGTADM